jgi:hypothetical protein
VYEGYVSWTETSLCCLIAHLLYIPSCTCFSSHIHLFAEATTPGSEVNLASFALTDNNNDNNDNNNENSNDNDNSESSTSTNKPIPAFSPPPLPPLTPEIHTIVQNEFPDVFS